MASTCLTLPGVASASELDEVIITAQKREQSLQDVGVSVTAFTGDQLKSLGLTDSIEISAQTPGLTTHSFGGVINTTNIRGVSQNSFELHQEPPNAVYIDGAYVGSMSASQFAMFDLKRVEVLRGPQGTLYGRNATGGLISYITAKPTDEFEGYVDVTFGEYEQKRVEGAVSGGISDNAQVRLSGLWEDTGGWMDDVNLGTSPGAVDKKVVRAQFSFQPNESLNVDLSASYGEEENTFSYVHEANGFDLMTGLEFRLPPDMDYWGTGAGNDPLGYSDTDGDFFTTSNNFPTRVDKESQNYGATVTWEGENITLTSITNFQDFQQDHREDLEASPRDYLEYGTSIDQQQFSQEIRLNGDSDRVNWTLGAYYLDIDHDVNTQFQAELGALDDVLAQLGLTALGDIDGDPTFGQTLGAYSVLNSAWQQETSSWAIFAQTEINLSDRLSLITGVRYGQDDKDYAFVSEEFFAGMDITAFPLFQVWGTENFVGNQDQGEWSGKVQLDFDLDDDTLLYAGISRGNKAGGFTAPIAGGTVSEFDQEILTSYEAGIKKSFASVARLNASVFYYDYNDYQGFSFENLAAQIGNFDATFYGAEAELAVTLDNDLDILLGASLIDTEVEGTVSPTINTEAPMSASFTANGLVRKAWNLGENKKVTAQADFSYVGDRFSDVINTPAAELDGYTIGNLRLSYGDIDDRWEVALLAKNITNEENVMVRLPTGLGSNQAIIMPPRWISAQFTYRFGN